MRLPPEDSKRIGASLDRLYSRLKEQNARVLPGVTDADIRKFEKEHGVRIPDEVREYFFFSNGMDYSSMGNDLIRFYPLFEVVDYDAHYGLSANPNRKWLVFADYFLASNLYAFDLTAEPVMTCPIVGIDGDSRTLACSLSEFLELYLEDKWDVLIA